MGAAKQQSVYQQSLIEQYHSVNGTHKTTVSGGPSGLEAIDQKLDKLRSSLQDLKTRYTDQYPEVQQVKNEIAETEKTREQMIASLKKTPEVKEQSAGNQAQEIEDPAQNAPLLPLQSQLKSDQLEISNRQAAIGDLKIVDQSISMAAKGGTCFGSTASGSDARIFTIPGKL